MKTAVIYTRVSTMKQVDTGISLETQLDILRKYCDLNNFDKVIEISDAGLSGKNTKRPGFEKVMDLVRKKKINAIVVYSLSRFGRNTVDIIQSIDVINKNGISFHSYTEKLDTTSASGKFFLTLLSALSQMERDVISERTKAALSYKKSIGECIGQIPFGKNLKDRKLIINRRESFILKTIKEWRDKGYSYNEIVDKLELMGAKNKNGEVSWHKSQVIRLLKNN
jgi:site-specific DNA recombinase